MREREEKKEICVQNKYYRRFNRFHHLHRLNSKDYHYDYPHDQYRFLDQVAQSLPKRERKIFEVMVVKDHSNQAIA